MKIANHVLPLCFIRQALFWKIYPAKIRFRGG
jgi:hypothetical protein